MRSALRSVGIPDHLGLAYDAWAPVGSDGKVPDNRRSNWLTELADLAVSPDYARAFERWKASFGAPGDRVFELTLASRLIVGHGNASATDVGLTLHHTWGVPIIPGAALKGLLAHYVDVVYGPENGDLPPWEQPEGERERARYQGVTWDGGGRRIRRGPGEVYRALFGAPEADEDRVMREHGQEAGALAGLVSFHEALYVPQSADGDRPFAVDVLTVHQKRYYDSAGKQWPNDYDSPNPVGFLTIRPNVRMLFALSGPGDWTELAERLLTDALREWEVGGKTSSGYGRLVSPGDVPLHRVASAGTARTATPALPRGGDLVDAILLDEKTRKGGWKAVHRSSGLAGPIHNSGDVPSDEKAGHKLMLIVASVNPHEIAFRYPTPADEQRAQQTVDRPKDRQRDRRPRGRK